MRRVIGDATSGIKISKLGFDALIETDPFSFAWSSDAPQLGQFFTGQISCTGLVATTAMFPVALGYIPLAFVQSQAQDPATYSTILAGRARYGSIIWNSNSASFAFSGAFSGSACPTFEIHNDRIVLYNWVAQTLIVRLVVFYRKFSS